MLRLLMVLLIAALSLNGFAADRAIKVKIKLNNGKVVPMYEHSYALVIGVSDYTDGWPDLPGVLDDITSVSDILDKSGFEVKRIVDPSRRQLLDSIENFISEYGLNPNNRLIIYFAGHGHTVKTAYGSSNGFIVPADAPNPFTNRNGFLRKAINMQQIEVFAKNAESKHFLFVFDSCFAGSIFNATRAVPEIIKQKTLKPVRQFITSGTEDQKVPDKSIFRRQFVEGLKGEADVNKDGYITGTELGQFLENKVTAYSKGGQTPRYGKLNDPNLDKGDFVFVLASAERGVEEASVETDKKEVKDKDDIEIEYWSSVKDSKNPDMLKSYMKKFPKGIFEELALIKLDLLEKDKKSDVEMSNKQAVSEDNSNKKKSGFFGNYSGAGYKKSLAEEPGSGEKKKVKTWGATSIVKKTTSENYTPTLDKNTKDVFVTRWIKVVSSSRKAYQLRLFIKFSGWRVENEFKKTDKKVFKTKLILMDMIEMKEKTGDFNHAVYSKIIEKSINAKLKTGSIDKLEIEVKSQ